MWLDDSKYRCSQCDERLDVPLGAEVRVTIQATSGEPNVRVITLDGNVLHRCETSPTPLPRAPV